jgi:carboxylesterase
MPFKPEYEVPEPRRAYTFISTDRSEWEGIGCLMLHGYMGSPVSSLEMSKFLSSKGITMHCPLLPGHGNLPYRIDGYTRSDWIAEAEEGLAFMRQHCDQVFIIGHSMGAVLGAHLAVQNRDICGLVLLAPLYDVPDWRIKLASFGRFFMPWFYPLKRKDVDRDIFVGRITDFDPTVDPEDPALQDWLVEESRLSMNSINEMRRMGDYGRKLWAKLHQPVLVFQGGNDPAVNPGNTEKLFQKLATADKEMRFFPQVGHELMRPVEAIHAKVWNKIYEFVEEHSAFGEKQPTPLNAPSLLVGKGE